MIAASGQFTLRGVKAVGIVAGQSLPPPAETAWMAAGLNDEVVSNVLTYLRGNPDWFDLYKAYEAMTNDTGRKPAGLSWPSEKQLSDFRKSAQLRRHSREWCVRQKLDWPGPISLPEALALIRSMAHAWLNWKCSRATPS
jgi:hypothetical protein